MLCRVFGMNSCDREFVVPPGVEVRYYHRDDPGVRGELQSWAAWIETQEDNPHRDALMLHLATTQHVYLLERPDDQPPGDIVPLVMSIAQAAAGVYQIDGEGIFDSQGQLLMSE